MQKHSIARAVAGARWNPRDGLIGGDQGLWLDPSDLATMFQDSAGTTPVTAVEQPVGLILDKRNTAYSTYFDGSSTSQLTVANTAELNLGTGNFTIECLVYFPSLPTGESYPNARFIFGTGPAAGAAGSQLYIGNTNLHFDLTSDGSGPINVPHGMSVNTWYHVAIVRTGNSFLAFKNGVQLGATQTNTNSWINNYALGIGSAEPNATAPASNFNGHISNLRIVKGTALYTANFTPPTAPLQPVAGTSLLTCGASWSGNPAITRFGDTRADKLNPFGTGTGNHVFQSTSANRPTLSARYNQYVGTEAMATQNVTTLATSYKLTFSGAGSITLSGTATGTYTAGTYTVTCTAGTLTSTVSGSVTQASLVPTNQSSLPYQRVNTATDYDSDQTKFPWYLKFNGTSSSLQTASINFTATDKMFVSAGVRKIDSNTRMVAELSANLNFNNGSFYLLAGNNPTDGWWYSSKGNTPQAVSAATSAISTNVVSSISKLSATSEIAVRVNGAQVAANNLAQGGGTYDNYQLYIGARAGTSLFFNGNLYQLVICGRPTAVPIDQITRTEEFVNRKTRAYA